MLLQWQHQDQDFQAAWRSESASQPPRKVQVVDDSTPADVAYRLACEGTALLWQGDFQNARHLLDALKRRLDKPARSHSAKARQRKKSEAQAQAFPQAFHLYRLGQAQRARVLNSVLVVLEADYSMSMRRAPDWREACVAAWGEPAAEVTQQVVALRELLGVMSAYEWRKKGVQVPALGEQARIHPHYGVFSPVRGEYVDLVAQAPLPTVDVAWDLGVGSGVLTALLLQRGVAKVVGTDTSARALACAADNLQRLGLTDRVQLQSTALFPEGQAGLIVCNPPWLPGKAVTTLEQAVYDENSQMLRGFLQGLRTHLLPGGEGWLILSDLAEHLGLRSREQLMQWMEEAGLQMLERLDTRPRHGKAHDASDLLFAARSKEVTSLWRLAAA